MTHQRLLRHLAVAVLIKLAVLVLLWWLFVRDARVTVDTDGAARHLLPSTTTMPTPTPGAPS